MPIIRPTVAASALAGIALAVPAGASELVEARLDDVTKMVGAPAGVRTVRLVVRFDDPGARVYGVGAGVDFGSPPLRLETSDPVGFRNEADILTGLPEEDIPTPLSAPWDTWVTVDLDGAAYLNGDLNDGVSASIAGSSIETTNGAWNRPGGVLAGDDLEVILGQFTVDDDAWVNVDATLYWQTSAGEDGTRRFLVRESCPGELPLDVLDIACGRADQDGDGLVGLDDLLSVLTYWGPVPAWRHVGGSTRAEAFLEGCAIACDLEQQRRREGLGGGLDWSLGGADERGEVAAELSGSTARLPGLDGTRILRSGHVLVDLERGCPDEAALGLADVRSLTFLEVLAPIPFDWVATSSDPDAPEAPALLGADGPIAGHGKASGVLEPGFYTVGAALLRVLADGDGTTTAEGAFDLVLVLHDEGAWSDVNEDGTVGFEDLVAVLAAWGPCDG